MGRKWQGLSSTSHFPFNSQELEIQGKKYFERPHKKESLTRWEFSKDLF
jgi:hypothetical protein